MLYCFCTRIVYLITLDLIKLHLSIHCGRKKISKVSKRKGKGKSTKQCYILQAIVFASAVTIKSGFGVNAQNPFNEATEVFPSKLYGDGAIV